MASAVVGEGFSLKRRPLMCTQIPLCNKRFIHSILFNSQKRERKAR